MFNECNTNNKIYLIQCN